MRKNWRRGDKETSGRIEDREGSNYNLPKSPEPSSTDAKLDLISRKLDVIFKALGLLFEQGEVQMTIDAGLVEVVAGVEGAAESALVVLNAIQAELADAKGKMNSAEDAAVIADVIVRLGAVKGKLVAAIPANDPVVDDTAAEVAEAAAQAAAEAAAKAVQDQLDADAAAAAVDQAARDAADKAAADAAEAERLANEAIAAQVPVEFPPEPEPETIVG